MRRWAIEHKAQLIHDADGAGFAEHDRKQVNSLRWIAASRLPYWAKRYEPCNCVAYKGLMPSARATGVEAP